MTAAATGWGAGLQDSREAVGLGIHGCGRIGRAVFRQWVDDHGGRVSVVNDAHASRENLEYLLRFDSVYGRWQSWESLELTGATPEFWSCRNIDEVDWGRTRVVLDCSGGAPEPARYQRLLDQGVEWVLVTQPVAAAVVPVIVSSHDLRPQVRHDGRVVSTGTCDAVAIVPVLRRVDRTYGIRTARIVTLHPALSYQNVLDNPLGESAPAARQGSFGLGRAAGLNVIPKETNLVDVLTDIDPDLGPRLQALSFRVPTYTVTCAVVDVELVADPPLEALVDLLRGWSYDDAFVRWSTDPVVSQDLSGSTCAATVDGRFLTLTGRVLRLVLWYDNEWGYAAHALRVVHAAVRAAT